MFQSISGHSSEQSRAHYSSRLTASQLKGISNTISNPFENHQPQRTQISTVANAPFIQTSNRMASSVDRNRKFCERILSTPAIFKKPFKLLGSQGYSDDKNWLEFSTFYLRFVDFADQFCFRRKFLIHLKRFSTQVWQWCDFPGAITILCYA